MLDDWMGTVNEVLGHIRAEQRRAKRVLYKRPTVNRLYGRKTRHKEYRQARLTV